MAKENLLFSALEELDFKRKNNIFYTVYRGFCILASPCSGYLLMDIALSMQGQDKSLKGRLNKALAGRGLSPRVLQQEKDTLRFRVSPAKKQGCTEELRRLLDGICDVLEEQGLRASDVCGVCGGAGPDSYCVYKGYRPVHRSCMQRLESEMQDSAALNQQNGSYLSGFLGAALGALVGMLPSLASAYFINTIYAVLFALAPLCAMWGYKKLNGKQDKLSIVIVIICSLLSVFIMEYVCLVLQLMSGYGVSFAEAAEAIRSVGFAETFSLMLSDSLSGIFFMALGIFFSWSNISSTNAVRLTSMADMLSTLSPINPYSAGSVSAEYSYEPQYGSTPESSGYNACSAEPRYDNYSAEPRYDNYSAAPAPRSSQTSSGEKKNPFSTPDF